MFVEVVGRGLSPVYGFSRQTINRYGKADDDNRAQTNSTGEPGHVRDQAGSDGQREGQRDLNRMLDAEADQISPAPVGMSVPSAGRRTAPAITSGM